MQAEAMLQEVYDKYKALDNRAYELRMVLIQAEKNRQDKYAQAMTINTDNTSVMETMSGKIEQ